MAEDIAVLSPSSIWKGGRLDRELSTGEDQMWRISGDDRLQIVSDVRFTGSESRVEGRTEEVREVAHKETAMSHSHVHTWKEQFSWTLGGRYVCGNTFRTFLHDALWILICVSWVWTSDFIVYFRLGSMTSRLWDCALFFGILDFVLWTW